MSNAKFIALVESILEDKKAKMLRALIESKGRRRLSEESDSITGDDIHDGLTQGDDDPDIAGVGSSGGGAGSTPAARKADGADTAQADIAHLEEEDDGQLDLDSLLTGQRDGDDVVTTEESDCEDEEGEELNEEAEDDSEDEEELEEETGLEGFFEEMDDEFDLGGALEEAKKAKKPVKKMVKKRK